VPFRQWTAKYNNSKEAGHLQLKELFLHHFGIDILRHWRDNSERQAVMRASRPMIWNNKEISQGSVRHICIVRHAQERRCIRSLFTEAEAPVSAPGGYHPIQHVLPRRVHRSIIERDNPCRWNPVQPFFYHPQPATRISCRSSGPGPGCGRRGPQNRSNYRR
jgi:hypothetical protein